MPQLPPPPPLRAGAALLHAWDRIGGGKKVIAGGRTGGRGHDVKEAEKDGGRGRTDCAAVPGPRVKTACVAGAVRDGGDKKGGEAARSMDINSGCQGGG